MTIVKEKESSQLSRIGKASKSLRATQSKCPICQLLDHSKRECRVRCKYCNRTGHAFGDCFKKPKDAKDGKDSKDSKEPKCPKKPAPKKKDKKDNKKDKKDNQGRRLDSDAEEQNSGLESPTEDGNQSNRLTFHGLDTASVSSTVRRLAELERKHLSMGDSPTCSNDTPPFLGTISKSRTGNGRGKEEKTVPDSGCTVAIVPLCIVKDHNLPIAPLDRDEPGMKGFGDHNVPLVGQTSFWFKARKFSRKKLVRALVTDTNSREILISWQLMLKWGCLPKSFPYPPPHHEDGDEMDESDDTCDVSMEHSVHQVKESSELQAMKEQLLSKYDSVFKEDLGPSDTMRGVVRVELQDNDVTPLHFTTPAPIPAQLHRAADKGLARCLAAGTLEECQHYTPWVSRELFVAKPRKPGQPLKARLVSDFRIVNKKLKRPNWPLEGSSSLLKRLNKNHRFFCTLDFSSGYHQCRLDPADRDIF